MSSPFNLQIWRNYMRGREKSQSFHEGLNETFCALHEIPHRSERTELTCSALIEHLITDQFWGSDDDFPAHSLALRQLAKRVDELHHDYHSFAHVREVMLSAIALIDRYERLTENKLPNEFKFNAILTALIHDIGHPGQKLAKNVETEAEALADALPKYCKYLPRQMTIEPTILGCLTTAQEFFCAPDELDKRYACHRNTVNRSGFFTRIHPRAREHITFTQIIGMSDILPSLASAERLAIGAMKFNIESNLPVTAESILQTAAGFLKAVEKSKHPFKRFGIPIDFNGLRKGLQEPALKEMLGGRIAAHQAKFGGPNSTQDKHTPQQ